MRPDESASPPAPGPPAEPPRGYATAIVTGIYFALVLCAPLIVRYAPEGNVRATTGAVQSSLPARCTAAPDGAFTCRSTAKIESPGRAP